jgi:glycosyltransferase involved in cell wall biosynthesis
MRALNLFYVHGSSIGYGRLGVNLARALTDVGVTVYDDMPQPEEAKRAHEHNLGASCGLANVVTWVSVPTHARGWWKGQYPVIFSMWEATRLPESFRETLHEFACVVVPSHQNLELFSRYHDNVHLVPLGIDPVLWHYEPRDPLTDNFRYLIGGSGPRKGTDLAHRAFRAVFPHPERLDPAPILMMKNPRREDYGGRNVEVIGGRISDEAELDLYRMAHCYLQPSRGEGFGLQPLQAMAQGIPTILTAAHGHDSFAHLGMGLSSKLEKSAYFVYGDAGDWWEPDFDELCHLMRWTYDNYDLALGDACKAAGEIALSFTWRHTAKGFVEAIGTHRLELPAPETTDWFAPQRRRYLVITDRDWGCDVAGIHYRFTKGQHYWELADVKRILFEADLLDPACLTGYQRMSRDEGTYEDHDVGLTEDEVARIPDYSARHSYCSACGQRLASHPTRADDIEAGVTV